MVKIVVGGQLNKEELVNIIKECGQSQVEVYQTSDTQAAMDVKTNKADFYIGCCQTGGGGSLAMPIALVGYTSCLTIASVGKTLSEDEIISAINNGKRCFGLISDAIPTVVPILVREMISFKA